MVLDFCTERIAAVKRFFGTVVMEREEKVCSQIACRIHSFFESQPGVILGNHVDTGTQRL